MVIWVVWTSKSLSSNQTKGPGSPPALFSSNRFLAYSELTCRGECLISFLMNHLQYNKKQKSGFSLLEAAVVLAVVATVIAAVWLAAASAKRNRSFAATVSGIISIASAIKADLYSQKITFSGQQIGTLAISMGIIPRDWVYGSAMRPPMGGTMTVWGWGTGIVTLQFGSLSKDACISFLMALSGRWDSAKTSVSAVWDNSLSSWVTFPIPISNSYCPTTSSNQLELHIAP